MKRTLIGGFLALLGSIWALVIISVAGNNLVNSWNFYLGRLYSTVCEYQLMFPFVIAVILAVTGLVVVLVELFRKEETGHCPVCGGWESLDLFKVWCFQSEVQSPVPFMRYHASIILAWLVCLLVDRGCGSGIYSGIPEEE